MAKQFVYMIGIEVDDWTIEDTKACKKYGVKVCGYYELGNNEGMILVGSLKQLMNVCEDWFGMEIVDDYLNEIDDFDYEDGRWITGGWFNLKEFTKSNGKNLKESIQASRQNALSIQTTIEEYFSDYGLDLEIKDYDFGNSYNVEWIFYYNGLGYIDDNDLYYYLSRNRYLKDEEFEIFSYDGEIKITIN